MIRRTRFRTILALFAAYLLMTTGVAQAAQPPKTDPTQGGSGGPAKVQQLRQDLLKQNAERKAAAEAGKKETPPAQPKKAERQTTVNPEPAFSAQSLAAPTAVPVPDQWQMLLSRDQFIPGEQTVVTGQLTAGGVPVAGATVRIGWNGMYGSYTTDPAGSVTFPYKAAYGPEAVPVEVQTATGTGRPAFLYTVPEGYSILTITSATDQNDAPLPFTFVSLSYYYPDHPGWSLHSGGMGFRDVFGSVRPAGLNHVEIASPAGVYLYEAVTLAPGERRSLQLSGAGAQPLTVSATFEGVPVGGQVYLHSERMDRESRYAWPLPPQVWVKPGAYSVLFKGNGPNTLFYRSGVSVTGPTALPFTETITTIAKVSVYSSDGYGKPFTVEHGKMTAGNIGFDLKSGLTYLATPGIGYRAWDYAYRTTDQTGQPWSYNFFADPSASPQVPAKGTEAVLTLGGPISVQLEGYGEPYQPGGQAYWFGTLRTPSGDEFLPQQGGSWTTGTLALRDAAGTVIWKAQANLPSFWVEMPLPTAAGAYTLTGDFPTGPYQPGPL
ncbi:MAG TPA: hypothetical protein VNT75_00345, partial [Symbiobacteriaceae bacterium]|nr:hypothetical protein [Symbiobacteriaceae bacterium]